VRLEKAELIKTFGERRELLRGQRQPGREPHPGDDLAQGPAVKRERDRVLVAEETKGRTPLGIVDVDASDAILLKDGRNQIAPQARPVKRHLCIFTRGSRQRQLSRLGLCGIN
jgi:hypothetical protein